jgi:hypothetical protein
MHNTKFLIWTISILILGILVVGAYEWSQLSNNHDAKLQAIASVLGNALGVLGAVFAVKSWLGLFEQFSGFYKWSLCRV